MKTSFWYANKLGHGSVNAVAESESVGIKVVKPSPSHRRVLVDDGGGLTDDTIAFLEGSHSGAGLHDMPSEFVAEDTGVVNLPTDSSKPLVQITATDTDGLDL